MDLRPGESRQLLHAANPAVGTDRRRAGDAVDREQSRRDFRAVVVPHLVVRLDDFPLRIDHQQPVERSIPVMIVIHPDKDAVQVAIVDDGLQFSDGGVNFRLWRVRRLIQGRFREDDNAAIPLFRLADQAGDLLAILLQRRFQGELDDSDGERGRRLRITRRG